MVKRWDKYGSKNRQNGDDSDYFNEGKASVNVIFLSIHLLQIMSRDVR